MSFHARLLTIIAAVLGMSSSTFSLQEENLVVGPNVNMVSGTDFPGGDPFLQRQNEPSGAVSSRNPLHLFAGTNDYRAVDIPFEVAGPAGAESGGDSWLGVFSSTDGGSRWNSTLLPGYPQDPECASGTPPALCGYEAGADPVVRAGTHGLFYMTGIVFDRGENAPSAVFVSRFMDFNNDEGGEPIRHIDTGIADASESLAFLDKPWIAVDIPRAGAQQALFAVPQGGPDVMVDCGNVYLSYASITGTPPLGDLESEILFRRSTDCGLTWSAAQALSDPDTLNQGANIAIAPLTGDVYVAWRQFSSVQSFLGEGLACVQGGGYWKNAPEAWPLESLMLGIETYTKAEALDLLAENPLGDATIILAKQLIAAKLNAEVESGDGLASLLELIGLADAWLMAHPIGSDPSDPVREEGLEIKNSLEALNQSGNPALCGTSVPPTTVLLDDAMMVAKSTDGGQTFSTPVQVSIASTFDQGSTDFSFRTTAYPTITVDAESPARVYAAWSERGFAASSPDPTTGDARIVLSTSTDGATWSAPVPIDLPGVRGHQIKPSLLFSGDRLVLAHYDFRQDVSAIFEQFVVDLPFADRLRHTVDVRVAIAEPGATPTFTDYSVIDGEPTKPSRQASRYPFVIVGDAFYPETIQLQYSTPNIPLFAGGTTPFIGDYIDIIAKRFVNDPEEGWRFATELSDVDAFHALWADNRDVVPPENGDWTSYVPPTLSGQVGDRVSLFDSAFTVPDCNAVTLGPQLTGMRNQNTYTALMTRGLLVATPGNTRRLGYEDGELVQRSFVVFVQNVTATDRRFRLTAGQPPDGDASFDQFTLQTQIDITVPAFSSASRTVYLRAPDPTASVLVLVTEIDLAGNPVIGGLTSSARLNPDPTSPAPDLSGGEIHTPAILNADVFTPAILNPAILNPAILNPAILNPAYFNPAIFNPAILNPGIFNLAIFNPAILNPAILNAALFNPALFNPAILNPAILNPAILNPAILNPAVPNPAILNPAILNPAILNPAILNPAILNTSLVDYTVTIENDGNMTTAYDLNLNVGEQPDGLLYQLLVFRVNVTPVANGCNLITEGQQELLMNLLNPEVNADRLLEPANGEPTTATFPIEPGAIVYVTLRVLPDPTFPTPLDPSLDFNDEQVSLAVVSQPLDETDLNVGGMQPPFDSILAAGIDPLVIDPVAPLPAGEVGALYPTQTFTATGGAGTRVWTTSGQVPPGLSLSPSGVLAGTPLVAGSFAFTVNITDDVDADALMVTIDVNASTTAFALGFGDAGFDIATAVAVDSVGDIIVVGRFEGAVDFGGGPRSVPGGGGSDLFVAKYSGGAHVWSQVFGSAGQDEAVDVAVDSTGDVFVTGNFQNAIDFGGTTTPLLSAGLAGFVTKLSSTTGAGVWSAAFGTTGDGRGWGVSTSTTGDVFVAGRFSGTTSFGTTVLTSDSGSRDGFVARLTGGTGAEVWARRFGGSLDDEALAVAFDSQTASDRVFVAGSFDSLTADFGGSLFVNAGLRDAFVVAYDGSTGAHLWSEAYGGSAADVIRDVAIDSEGNLATVGIYGDVDADFGGGLLPSPATVVFPGDFVVAKYKGDSGDHLWSRGFGSEVADSGLAIAVDGNDDVIATGSMGLSIDFGLGFTPHHSGNDIFVLKLSGDVGTTLRSDNFGSDGNDWGAGIATEPMTRDVILAGQFGGTVDFGLGIPLVPTPASTDAFLARLELPSTERVSLVHTAVYGDVLQDIASSVTADSSNDLIVTGGFSGTVDFGSGLNLTSAGDEDIFVAKYSSTTGGVIWAVRAGDATLDRGVDVVVDGNDDVVVIGDFSGTINFGGLTSPLPAVEGNDIFLVKLSGVDGSAIWSHGFGGGVGGVANFDDGAGGLAVDPSNGDVVITGRVDGAVSFGGTLFSPVADPFVARFDTFGAHLWSRVINSLAGAGTSIAVDGNGDVVVSGNFFSSADFGGGFLLSSTGQGDVFLAKLDESTGTTVWAQNYGGPEITGEVVFDTAVDTLGDIFIVGYFRGTAAFGDAMPLVSVGDNDIFIAKYSNVDGSHIWSRAVGGTNADSASGVFVGENGDVVVAGEFRQSADFGSGYLNDHAFLGGSEAFVAEYHGTSGRLQWLHHFGGFGSNAQPTHVVVDNGGDVGVAGVLFGSIDFGDGSIPSAGGLDWFLLKLDRPLVMHSHFVADGSTAATYAFELAASGGAAERVWTVVGGALPMGLSLSADGILSGTPTEVGDFAFTVRLTDGVTIIDRPFMIHIE